MEWVKLRFPSPDNLWKFLLTIEAKDLIIVRDLTFICQCTDEQIELALTKFKAVVVANHSFDGLGKERTSSKTGRNQFSTKAEN